MSLRTVVFRQNRVTLSLAARVKFKKVLAEYACSAGVATANAAYELRTLINLIDV